jgi:hypothetical protein
LSTCNVFALKSTFASTSTAKVGSTCKAINTTYISALTLSVSSHRESYKHILQSQDQQEQKEKKLYCLLPKAFEVLLKILKFLRYILFVLNSYISSTVISAAVSWRTWRAIEVVWKGQAGFKQIWGEGEESFQVRTQKANT